MSHVGDLEEAIVRRVDGVFAEAGIKAVNVLAMPNDPDAVKSTAKITLLIGFARTRYSPHGALGGLTQKRATEIALAWKFQNLRHGQAEAYPYLEAVRVILNGWRAIRASDQADAPEGRQARSRQTGDHQARAAQRERGPIHGLSPALSARRRDQRHD